MSVLIRQIHPLFVGEVSGVDLREPLRKPDADAIDAGMQEFGVLVFHDQNITDEQQVAFSRNFGDLEIPGFNSNITKVADRRLGPEMADVSNLGVGQRILERDDRQRMFNLGNLLWHSDSSFRAVPAKYSILSGREVPEKGGDTQFADMRAAYDALDAETQDEIDAYICEHSLLYSRGFLGFTGLSEDEQASFKPVRQSLVRRHLVTGRKSLYLSAHIGKILGLSIPEGRFLIRDLTENATRPDVIYAHHWRQYDLVMWDNTQTMHRARRFNDTGEARDMRRTTIAGEAQTVEQAA
ncbi:MAG: TauD/TfdA family dioxygenase [Alphaproteobacteria bacterium]|nr:TauD/TfdA family dioxygenase [Alphaproteobacteria bacterium]